jgi:hypothetical protein
MSWLDWIRPTPAVCIRSMAVASRALHINRATGIQHHKRIEPAACASSAENITQEIQCQTTMYTVSIPRSFRYLARPVVVRRSASTNAE